MFSNIAEIENIIGYSFNDKKLLIVSLTHASYANENNIDKSFTNQRLEFLGDAVLELVSSDFLYNQFSKYNEGLLTKTRALIVCEDSLSAVARKLNLYNYLLIGKGENHQNLKNNNSIMCDTIEAVIGAIYKDGGIKFAEEFIKKFILTEDNLNKSSTDYKSILQENANANNKTLSYEVISVAGPDHNKEFEIDVIYDNCKLGKGKGKSKKEAEQNAAKQALSNLKLKCI